MSKLCPDYEDGASDRYKRLEELLRQTIEVAGEIAEDKARPLPGECIILQRISDSNPTGATRQLVSRSLGQRRKALKLDDSEDSQSQSHSPASSIQEPFSPGSLAVSLDAVVEKGKTTDTDLCILDNASATSVAVRLGEPPSNWNNVLSTDEGQHGLAVQDVFPHLVSNANAPKRLQRPSLQQKNTSMIVHSGQESPLEVPKEISVPQQIKDSLRHEQSAGRRWTCAYEPSEGSSARPRSPKSHRLPSKTRKRPQTTGEERLEGDTTAESRASSMKWQVRILPVSSSRDSGSPSLSPPAFLKLEAVFPLKSSAEGNVTSPLSCNGEPSYIIIGRPPIHSSPDSPHPRADDDEIPITKGPSLQEFIDEWEYDAEASPV